MLCLAHPLCIFVPQADSDFYTLKIVDSEKFEDKIRKAELELGIKPEQGISISYQREK